MRMRRISAIAFVSLALLSWYSFASASSTSKRNSVKTTVPSKHTVTVVCRTGGKVQVGSEPSFSSKKEFDDIARHSSFSLTAIPNTNYALNTITSSPSIAFTLRTDGATIPKVSRDVTLTVTFKYSPSTDTGTGTSGTSGTSGSSGSSGTTGTDEYAEEGNRLYSNYLGKRGGNPDLFILYNRDDRPSDYQFMLEKHTDEELLAGMPPGMPPDEQQRALNALHDALPDTARVISKPDMLDMGDGESQTLVDEMGKPVYGHRSMRMYGEQLARLEEQGMRRLAVENNEFDVSLLIEELYGGDLAKLIVLAYERGEELPDNMPSPEELSAMPEVTTWLSMLPEGQKPQLTSEMFMGALLDIRITPVKNSDVTAASTQSFVPEAAPKQPDEAPRVDMLEFGQLSETERAELTMLIPYTNAYRANVFMTVNGVEFEITDYITTLRASLYIQPMIEMEIEGLTGTNIPEDMLETTAREILLDYACVTAIDTDGDIRIGGYHPGMYTQRLETVISDNADAFEEAVAMLESVLIEEYDVEILRDMAASGMRAEVSYLGDSIEDIKKGNYLVADAPTGGLYLAAEQK